VSYFALFCFLVVSRARVPFCCAPLIVWVALIVCDVALVLCASSLAQLRSRCSVDIAHVVSFTVCRLIVRCGLDDKFNKAFIKSHNFIKLILTVMEKVLKPHRLDAEPGLKTAAV